MLQWLRCHSTAGQPQKTFFLTMNHDPPLQLQAYFSIDGKKIINPWGLECILSFGLETVVATAALVGMTEGRWQQCAQKLQCGQRKSRTSAKSRARISKARLMANGIFFSKPVIQWCMKEDMLSIMETDTSSATKEFCSFWTKAIPQMSYKWDWWIMSAAVWTLPEFLKL